MATHTGIQNIEKVKICSILGKDRLVDKNAFLVCDSTENLWTAWTENVSVDCFDGKPVLRERFCINDDCEGIRDQQAKTYLRFLLFVNP